MPPLGLDSLKGHRKLLACGRGQGKAGSNGVREGTREVLSAHTRVAFRQVEQRVPQV